MVLWALAFLALGSVAAIPFLKLRHGVEPNYYSVDADGTLSPGGATSPISAVIDWRVGEATLFGQPVATYIHSRIEWIPSRPSDKAIREMYAALLRSQPEEAAAYWRWSDYEARLTQPPGSPYQRFRLERGAWVVPVAATFIAALLAFAMARFSAVRHQRRAGGGCCPTCAYNRAGLEPGAACPECGLAWAPTAK
jgi:hypothetical protein